MRQYWYIRREEILEQLLHMISKNLYQVNMKVVFKMIF